MTSIESLKKRLDEQDKKIDLLEKKFDEVLNIKHSQLDTHEDIKENEISNSVTSHVEEKKSLNLPKISFNQIITFLGITGIIIGSISFFFYAVANNWIGKGMQIAIGFLVGFVLFGLAYSLKDKKKEWSYIVFGGSYFIEYLTIAVGVLAYRVIDDFFGLILSLAFLASSLILSLKFKSRSIAYFSLFGGYLIPFITGFGGLDLFVLGFYLLLGLGLIVVSFKLNFSDLRFVSFMVLVIFILVNTYKFSRAQQILIPMIFLMSVFFMTNISSIINSIKNKSSLSILDTISLSLLPIIILPQIYFLLDLPNEIFGVLVMAFSLIYFLEIFIFKKQNLEIVSSVYYAILSSGIITLNLGLIFLMNNFNSDYLFIVFLVQWALWNILKHKSKLQSDKVFYNICFFISLGLMGLWYLFGINFRFGLIHATVYMLSYLAVVLISFYFFKKDINFQTNAATFIISGFLFIYSLHKYLFFFIKSSYGLAIFLSIMWLVYTLFLFSQVKTKNGKILVGVLLGITLFKIATMDLLELKGAYRIVGFIIFGILLLIGGYFIKNETNKN